MAEDEPIDHMGHAGKYELREQAIKLRREGQSIRFIQNKLNVSKSSASIWTRDVILSDLQVKKLYGNKINGGIKGGRIAAMNKKRKREEITTEIMNLAQRDIGRLSVRDKFLCGIVLYFAEGDKADKNVAFTNSNPQALKFMTFWLRKYCKVKSNRIRCNIFIHENQSEDAAINYWSRLLLVPPRQFKKSYIVRNNPNRFRHSKHEFGIVRITVSDVNLHRKIMGWISGVFRL